MTKSETVNPDPWAMNFGLTGRPKLEYLTLFTLAIGIFLRLLFLDADPHYYEWAGYITDEGRWVEHARNYFLFKEIPGNLLHLLMAPIFQIIHYGIFSLFGISMITCRVFTATAGSAILVLFWIFFRRFASPQTLLLGIGLLAFQTDLVMLSRVAVPEMACIFFQLLIYVIILSSEGSSRRMFVAGLLMTIMVLTKLTTAPMLAIYSLMIIFMPKKVSAEKDKKQKWRDLMIFWSGFAVIPIVTLLLFLYFGKPTDYSFIPAGERIVNHLKLSSLYGTINFIFEHPFSITLNVLALGIWLSTLGILVTNRKNIDILSRRYLITSAIWIVLYFLLMQFLGYFPTRYKIGILIPIIIHIIMGVSLLQKTTLYDVLDSFKRSKGFSKLVKLTILGLPTAVFVAPLLADIGGYFSGDPGQLRIKLSALFASIFLMICVAYGKKNRNGILYYFLVFPFITAILWLCLNIPGIGSFTFWPEIHNPNHFVWWPLVLILASLITILLTHSNNLRKKFTLSGCVVIAAIFYMVISVIGIYPQYGEPHYSIRDTSKELFRLYSGNYNIKCIRAEGLFNNNQLRYRSPESEPRKNTKAPKILLVAFANDQIFENFLKKKCYLVKAYDIYVSPEYYRLHPDSISLFPRKKLLRVYRKNNEIN